MESKKQELVSVISKPVFIYLNYLFIYLLFLTYWFESNVQGVKCDHSTESHQAVLSCGAIYYVVQGGSNV